MYVPMQSTWPHYYQATFTRGDHKPVVESLSALDLTAPGLAAVKLAKMRLNGLGDVVTQDVVTQEEVPAWMTGTAGLVILGVVVVVAGALNYQMGKAMAPSKDKSSTWGWIGVPVGFLPLGLPIMAIVSNSEKGW